MQTVQEPGLQQKRKVRRNVLGFVIRNTDTEAALTLSSWSNNQFKCRNTLMITQDN